MNLAQLFDLNYWITTYPGPMSTSFLIGFLVFFLLHLAVAVGLSVYERKNKARLQKPIRRLFGKIRSAIYTMAFLGLLWLYFAYETLPVLSARFWFLFWLLGAAIWKYHILAHYFTKTKQELEEIRLREQRNKYLK